MVCFNNNTFQSEFSLIENINWACSNHVIDIHSMPTAQFTGKKMIGSVL